MDKISDDLPKRKPIHIDVIATHLGEDKFDYRIEIKDHEHNNNGNIKTPRELGCEINFTLVRKAEDKVRFDASAPIFVRKAEGPECPTTLDRTQILVDSCTADKLVVVDWNWGEAAMLKYQLNFTNPSGQKELCAFDPVIQNTGGAIKPT